LRKTWLIAVVAVVVFAACGGSDNSPAPNATKTPETMNGALTQAAQPLPTGQASDGNAPGIPVLKGDIKTTPGGLRYIDEKVGDGASPTPQGQVTANYTAWLSNGHKFDSSFDRSGPEKFSFTTMVKAWQEGVATMKVGGKRRLIAPPDLAYGANGVPPLVPPNATIIWDIDLVAAN
jgi:peptidylprolyl isomerase